MLKKIFSISESADKSGWVLLEVSLSLVVFGTLSVVIFSSLHWSNAEQRRAESRWYGEEAWYHFVSQARGEEAMQRVYEYAVYASETKNSHVLEQHPEDSDSVAGNPLHYFQIKRIETSEDAWKVYEMRTSGHTVVVGRSSWPIK